MKSKWIFSNDLIYCKECNVTTQRVTPYCAWCGAKMVNFFKPQQCDAYHTDCGFPQCYGTKEREPCACGGDKRKCDFYPELREHC